MNTVSLKEDSTNTSSSTSTCINYVTDKGKSSSVYCPLISKPDFDLIQPNVANLSNQSRKLVDCTTEKMSNCPKNSIISPICTYSTLMTNNCDQITNSANSLLDFRETPSILLLDTKHFSSNSISPSSLTSSKSENNIFEGNFQQPYSIFDVVSLNDVSDAAYAFNNSSAMNDLSKNRMLNVNDTDHLIIDNNRRK